MGIINSLIINREIIKYFIPSESKVNNVTLVIIFNTVFSKYIYLLTVRMYELINYETDTDI